MNRTQFRMWSRNRRLCFRTHTVSYARLETFARATGLSNSAAAHYVLTAALEQIQQLTTREGFDWVVARLPQYDRKAVEMDVDWDTLADIPY